MANYKTFAGALGFSAVALGAFGSHALRSYLEHSAMLQTWNTAVLYLMLHACALLAISLSSTGDGLAKAVVWAARLWVVGSVLFSGSLFLMALTGLRVLGLITPLGGACLLGGWSCIVFSGVRTHRSSI